MTTSAPTHNAPSTLLFADAPFGDDDPRAVFARAVTLAGSVIDAVTPADLGRSTPCDDFDVTGLLRHISALLPRVAAIGRGEVIGGPASIDGDIAFAEWSTRWTAGATEVESVWHNDAILDQTIVLPWGTKSGAEALDGYTSEVTVHTWDLAQAIGVSPPWADDVLTVAFRAISRGLPADGRRAMFDKMMADVPLEHRAPAPFAEAVDVPADAPMIDRLVAWNGRRP